MAYRCSSCQLLHDIMYTRTVDKLSLLVQVDISYDLIYMYLYSTDYAIMVNHRKD